MLPRMFFCSACGFMSTRGNLFDSVGEELLCQSCIERHTYLFYFEADGESGLTRGRSLHLAHESLSHKLGIENITVFREATGVDVALVEGGD